MYHKQVWRHLSVSPELRKLGQENVKFGERRSYVGRAYLQRTRSQNVSEGLVSRFKSTHKCRDWVSVLRMHIGMLTAAGSFSLLGRTLVFIYI